MTIKRRFKLEKGIGNRAADALMEEKKEERDFSPFWGEAKAIMLGVSLN